MTTEIVAIDNSKSILVAKLNRELFSVFGCGQEKGLQFESIKLSHFKYEMCPITFNTIHGILTATEQLCGLKMKPQPLEISPWRELTSNIRNDIIFEIKTVPKL